MTSANPAFHVTDENTGQRFYPIDGENYWSVSTAVGVIDKEALKSWAASLAAKFAFDELPTLLSASMAQPCGRTYYKCKHDWRDPHDSQCACRVCEVCVQKWLTERHKECASRRADEGKRTHAVIEWWALHGEWVGHDDDIAPYVRAAKTLVDQYGLQPADFLLTEAIVINRAHKYAGTTDGIIRFHARRSTAAAELVARALSRFDGNARYDAAGVQSIEPVTVEQAIDRDLHVDLVVDFKTQDKPVEKEKFYPPQALQLAGYRWAPVIRIKNTEVEAPMPDTHGAALIHLRPDGCTVRLTVADEATFGAFLLALGLFKWLVESGTASVSTRSFPLPKAKSVAQPAKVTRRTTVRKAAPQPLGVTADDYPLPEGARLTDEMLPF